MTMIYELEYIVCRYMPRTHMWNDIQHALEATDDEMQEAFDEMSENIASDIECDVEVMAEDWLDRHSCAYENDLHSAVRRIVNDRIESDDYDD